MAGGRAAARDLRYGRRGGGWAEDGSGRLLDDLDGLRDADGALKKKPTDRPCRVCGLPAAEHSLCSVCLGPLEHHPDGRTPESEWWGRARQAHARRTAGVPLDATDRQALDLYPDCPPPLLGGDLVEELVW